MFLFWFCWLIVGQAEREDGRADEHDETGMGIGAEGRDGDGDGDRDVVVRLTDGLID